MDNKRRQGGRRARPVDMLIAAALLIFVAPRQLVYAHLEVVTSSPSPDAVLSIPPTTVTITFSGRVSADSRVEVVGEGFQPMQVGTASLASVEGPDAGRTVAVALGPLKPGYYTVQWLAIDADDQHPISGSYGFEVKQADNTSAVSTSAGVLAGLTVVALALLAFARRRRSASLILVAGFALALAVGVGGCGSAVAPQSSPTDGAEPAMLPTAGSSTAISKTDPVSIDASPPVSGEMPAGMTALTSTGGAQIAIASSDLAVGRQRFAFAILGAGSVLEKDAAVSVRFFSLLTGQPEPLGEATKARFYASALEEAGLYVVYTRFAEAGAYGAEIGGRLANGTPMATQRVRFVVGSHSLSPAEGEAPPPTQNRTLETEPNLAALTSDPTPDTDFYKLTVDAAARSGKPTVVVFATPGYCQSRLCAPVMDEIKAAKAKWAGEINFIHIEVYKTFQPLVYADEMAGWNLETEPWVFVLDAAGKVAERLEGNVTLAELDPILRRVAAGQ